MRGDSEFGPKLGKAALAAAALTASTCQSMAGGFLVREQSTQALGTSMAGVAAGGGGLGSMFWNPATMTDYPGMESSYSFSGVAPNSKITAHPGSTLLPLGASSGQISRDALVPASASSYQLSDKFWLGLSMASPFGTVTRNPNVWAGSPFGIDTKITTINVNPNVAYRVNDWLSIAAGMQIERFQASQSQAISLPAPFGPGLAQGTLKGYSYGLGYTLGATLKPWAGGEIGVGYRSRVQESVNGTVNFGATTPQQPLPAGIYLAHLDLTLPDEVTVGLRQRVTSSLTLLTGFEWTDWSLLGSLPVTNPGTGPLPPAGATYSKINFNYRNGWMASAGAEYIWNDNLTLRAGTAYERSPVTDANRQITSPDADRIWVSVGAGYRFTPKLTGEFAYSHLFVKSGSITYTTPVAFIGTADSSSDIVSLGLNYRWDDPTKPIKAKF
jgi:long-chain fatty acid transport protein